jgi:hypothetical protein
VRARFPVDFSFGEFAFTTYNLFALASTLVKFK